MLRTLATDRTEIIGAFIGKDEVEAAMQGSHSDRAAMARRIASSLGYNGHLAYVRGDDVGARQSGPASNYHQRDSRGSSDVSRSSRARSFSSASSRSDSSAPGSGKPGSNSDSDSDDKDD
jgi:hypothetical protein